MGYHILIPDAVDAVALDVLKQAGEFRITAPGNMARADTLAAIGEADALILRSSTKADAELLAAAPKLKAIARAGVGVDNVDLKAASERGIVVMNTPDGNTIAAAEMTFGLMLALARHIPQGHASLAAGKWDRKSYMGVELRGKRLGILGIGRIGRALAKRALAFEMEVIATDPYVKDSGVDGVRLTTMEEVLTSSDFISLHVAMDASTRGMIHRDVLAKMKRGVRIINVARGPLIVEADLAEAIQFGQVAGAALDVFSEEPPQAGNPLIGLPGVIHTPHLGASTADAQVNVAIDAARLIVDGLLKGEYHNVVNPDVLKK